MRVGTRLGPYEIIAPLGAGGMGEVYRARDSRLEREVAIKMLPPTLAADPERLKRFEKEVRATAALNHPNILAVHDVGSSQGAPYLVEELLEGETLREVLKNGPLPPRRAIEYAVQIALGLAAAHGKGIVHRDLKPENLFVTQDGHIKILDFGLAKQIDSPLRRHEAAEASTLVESTDAWVVLGTVGYMSPEQVRGQEVDHRTDIFALGCVLYEMLSGERGFRGETPADTLSAILSKDPPPLSGPGRAIPPALQEIVSECLEKRCGDRFSSAHDLALALRACSGAGESPPLARPAARSGGRRPWKTLAPVAGAGAAAVIAITLLVAVRSARVVATRWLSGSSVPRQQHMAVLPFTNVGNDPANLAFCDGLTEILASTLTQFERFRGALWVVPATELRTREIKSASEARQVFNVNLVFTGGVQRAGDRLRLAVNLVDTANLRQLRSKVIEGTPADLTSLEDRVVAAMAEMLDLQLKPDEKKELTAGGTTVPAAYDLYVQARGALGSYQGERDPQRAADLFKQAIALDPGFALAQAGLSSAYLELYFWKKDPHLVDEATASARRAAEMNDRLAEVHVTLGEIYRTTGKYEDSVREFQHALELDPRSSTALGGLARAFDALGKPADAEATYKRAMALKPGYWLTHSRLGNFYAAHGRHDDAEKQLREVIALAPENVWGYNNLAVLYFTLGRYAEARKMFERAVSLRPSYSFYSNLGTLAFIQRNWAEAVARFEQARALDDKDYVLWGNLGIAYHWLGEHEQQSRAALTKAIALTEQQLAVNPRDTAVLADLAGYHTLLGEKDKALSYLRRVEADGRKSPDLAIQIADVYNDLGQPDTAITWIRTGLDLGFPPKQLSNLPALDALVKDPRVQKMLRAHSAPPPQQGR